MQATDSKKDTREVQESNIDLGTMLKEFGSERLIGMLHAFILLKPALSKVLRDREEQVVKVTDLK